MKINELPSTVERAWDFIVPSIVEALIAILIVILIAGNAPLHSLSAILRPYLDILKDPEVIKLLSAYGIIKLMPIILLFILLLVTYTFDKVAHLIGGLLPITLSWDNHAIMARKVSASLVADVWKHYPDIDNVPDLHRLIDERFQRANIENDPLFATAIFYQERIGKLSGRLNFVQFLVILSAIIPVAWAVSITSGWTALIPKTFGVIILLLIIYALLVRQQLKYCGQFEFSKVFSMRTSLQAQMQRPAQPDEEKKRGLQKKCADDFEIAKRDKVIGLYYKWK